jgi:hypothetical protein
VNLAKFDRSQWVGESDWRFKTTFNLSDNQMVQDNVDLVFEGLDTFCHVEVVGTTQSSHSESVYLFIHLP